MMRSELAGFVWSLVGGTALLVLLDAALGFPF